MCYVPSLLALDCRGTNAGRDKVVVGGLHQGFLYRGFGGRLVDVSVIEV